jgi:hypothetical protein
MNDTEQWGVRPADGIVRQLPDRESAERIAGRHDAEVVRRELGPWQPVGVPKETCPTCRHRAHGSWCPNLGSDNDCSCSHVTVSALGKVQR